LQDGCLNAIASNSLKMLAHTRGMRGVFNMPEHLMSLCHGCEHVQLPQQVRLGLSQVHNVVFMVHVVHHDLVPALHLCQPAVVLVNRWTLSSCHIAAPSLLAVGTQHMRTDMHRHMHLQQALL